MFLINTRLFGENLAYFRRREGYSEKQLATLADLTPHVIQSLESGVGTPSDIQLRNIAKALRLKEESLIMPRPTEPPEFYEDAC
jgi:transcriptional regulator with XRE-family HTH domain